MVVLRAALCGLVVVPLVLAGACAAPPPPFVLDPQEAIDGDTPAVVTSATAEGAHATLTLALNNVGPAFGVSLHVQLPSTVQVDEVTLQPVLGSEGVVPVRSIRGGDVALGAVRTDGAEQDIADGPFATLALTATDGAPVHVVVARALARRSDGAFVSLVAQSGVLTLEAP